MQFDVVIIGSGVAGLTAALYSARAGKSTLIIENSIIGGTTATLETVENYPGFAGKTGAELISTMVGQVFSLSVSIEMLNIEHIDYENKNIYFTDGQICTYKALVIATGTSYIPLGINAEERLKFKGISYCATCDGRLYKDKKVVVVTNGAKGADSIDYLEGLASELIVIDTTNLYKNNNLQVFSNATVVDIEGDEYVEGIQFISNGNQYSIKCSAVFVCLGKDSNISLFENKIKTKNKKIITDDNMQTNIDGVFAAGDIRDKELRQIVTACSDGAIAATQAIKYLSKLK
ncbi:MAG: FAD-dependent oxidoreductase [Clostridiales bacterium]|nr:FAD-dependent oxidoreductase [Clostridiales bacterium]